MSLRRARVLTRSVVAAAAGLAMVGLIQVPALGTSLGSSRDSPSTAPITGEDALRDAVDAILDQPVLDGATVSVIVRDARTGETLYRRDPHTRLNPASNAKIFTSLAAMGTLGPRWRFRTDLLAPGAVRHGTLTSDVYLRGGGDPTLLQRDYERLASDLREQGVRRIRGDVVADDHYFDQVPFGPGWAWDDTPYYYSAVTSGLTLAPDTDYDSGTVIVQARPGTRVGARVRMSTHPSTGVLDFVVRGKTSKAGSRNTLSVERAYGSNVVTVTGHMPLAGGRELHWIPVPDPTAYAADVFTRALHHQGIRATGATVSGRTPAHADRLARHTSQTLATILTPFLKLSNNMHAEALTKTMGRVERGRGGWGPGTAVIRRYTRSIGVPTTTMRLWDGSGLSRFDLISARTISDVLLAARDQPWFETWYEALPVACRKDRMVGGTLAYRMCGTTAAGNVHAKTGSLAAVSALSGYVTDAAGDPLVFSMLTSNVLRGNPGELEDALAETLAEWSP